MTASAFAVFDPDQPVRFLGATKFTVTIAVTWYDDTDADYGTGALQLSRSMFSAAMNKWLDIKTDSFAAGLYGEDIEIMFIELERMPIKVLALDHVVDRGVLTTAPDENGWVLVQGLCTTIATDFKVFVESASEPPNAATTAAAMPERLAA